MSVQQKKLVWILSGVVLLLVGARIVMLNLDVDEFGTYCGGLSTADPFSSHGSDCICLGEKQTHVGIGATKITCDGIVLW